ncbi:MAG: hypothetical protein N3A62_06740 [Thermodesulfovibrionales bacterium]|nr:hypothetical protein [Thermodesulfovibrionales bacterium]
MYIKEFGFRGGKLICVYNPEKEVAKRNFAIDRGEFNQECARYYGYSVIYHNTEMDAKEVVRTYYEKDIIEKAFREIKSSIELHPIREYRMEHIKAHVKICYIAYAMLIYVKQRLKDLNISPIEALEQLQSCYIVNLISTKHDLDWTKTVTLKNQQKAILKALGCGVIKYKGKLRI